MPVVGHAFAVWATAIALPPRTPGAERDGVAAALWTPAVIALAYLPDLASQALAFAGVAEPTPVTHSLVVATAAAPALAWFVARAWHTPFRRALAVTALSLFGHVLLDLMQNPERRPFWPLSEADWVGERTLLPWRARTEALLSAAVFLAFLWLRRSWSGPAPVPRRRTTCDKLGLALTAVLVVAAGGTHWLRNQRDATFDRARRTLERGDAASALHMIRDAERWPARLPPGRADYVRAEAYLTLGDRAEAERYYLAACEADASFFWPVADLAVFYADAEAPLAERRARVAPWLRRLERDFARHRALPRVRVKIERRLHAAAPDAAGSE